MINGTVKLIDLTYYAHLEADQPEQVLSWNRESLGFLPFMSKHLHLEVIKHLNYEGIAFYQGVKCCFFKKSNHFYDIPFKTHRYLKKQKPDVILVQGLIFPLQVLFLRLALGRKIRIIAQHHGEMPYGGLRSLLQKLADRYIDAYLFTSLGNAAPWISRKIISSGAKCHEVLEASTYLEKQDKQEARMQLAMAGNFNFLWVGRLNANKDPLTVLQAFRTYSQVNEQARLYMIYQEESLLPAVAEFIRGHRGLGEVVSLVGRVDRQQLATWYSAVDFYLSASHHEGSGYALLEAMSCGCVPVVTDIPPFRKITGEGQYGFLYQAGEPESLLACLQALPEMEEEGRAEAQRQHFVRELSFQAIAEKLTAVVSGLIAK
jgi:glycosyltransferase involved in cell wall biosynthesis